MQVSVKFYASYKKMTGVEQAQLDVPEGTTVAGFLKILAEKYGSEALNRDESLVVINEKFVMRDYVLREGDSVMLFHQFAGG